MSANQPLPESARQLSAEQARNSRDLFIKIQIGAFIGREVAKRRPGRAAIGAGLVALADVASSTISVALLAAQPDESPEYDTWSPSPGSSGFNDEEALASGDWSSLSCQFGVTDRNSGRVLYMARYLAHAVLDNLQSVGVLMMDPRPTRGPYAMARVALEAQAQLLHVVREGLDPVDRLVRCLNIELRILAETARSHSSENRVEESDPIRQEVETILTAVEEAGKPVRRARWDSGGRRGAMPKIEPRATTSEMLADLSGEIRHFDNWHVLSSVVHSQEGWGFRALAGLEGFDNPHADQMMALQLFQMLYGFERSFEDLGAYLMWDFTPIAVAVAELRDLWCLVAGFNDEALRQEVELDFAKQIAAIRQTLEATLQES